MRRVLMGLVWFLVLAVALFVVLQILIALYITLQAPKGVDQAAALKAATDLPTAMPALSVRWIP